MVKFLQLKKMLEGALRIENSELFRSAVEAVYDVVSEWVEQMEDWAEEEYENIYKSIKSLLML